MLAHDGAGVLSRGSEKLEAVWVDLVQLRLRGGGEEPRGNGFGWGGRLGSGKPDLVRFGSCASWRPGGSR